ncbi:Pex12 amino terminal region-domain-containing protein [Lineolata rhizophorae]|uniref:Peroxisome assembly protein 12 n=1 Tax=Lineolata rhizophorae TaxID=578093 RepID=A0A6A6P5C6_9PEZI|nr:Pex12 amino terminal region-domain-containing protein [Lineolata rhizophorae]
MEFMTNLQNGFDELKPSLFEVLSEQQLSALLPPSLRYLLALATHRRPRYLIRVLNSFDEAYALLSLLVERHYLRTHGGGFTEHFYGLKRERVLRVRGGELPRAQLAAPAPVRDALRLRDRDVWANLAVMVGVPYLKRKLDEGWEVHAAHAGLLDDGGPGLRRGRGADAGSSLRERVLAFYKWFLRRIYPSVNAAYYFSHLAFQLAYLFDETKYASPLLWLVGTRIRRMGPADYRAIEEMAAASSAALRKRPAARPGQNMSLLHPRTMVDAVYPRMLSSLKFVLPTAIFALKFLEWWHASDFARQLSRKAAEGLELPPPIVSGLERLAARKRAKSGEEAADEEKGKGKADDSFASAEKIPAPDNLPPTPPATPPIASNTLLPIFTVPYPPPSPELCPICLSPVVTPTATPAGLVYCYGCVHRWVAGTHERQAAFMEGRGGNDEEGWGVEEDGTRSREGRWESGVGREPVTGRRILGGVEGLRRVVV